MINGQLQKGEVDILSFAKEKGKSILNLENPDKSVEAYQNVPPEYLLTTIKNWDNYLLHLKDAVSFYQKGNMEKYIESILKSMDSNKVRESLIWERNIALVDSIQTLMHKNSTFFAIEPNHLPSKKGVIEILKKKGYNLRPIAPMLVEKEKPETANSKLIDFSEWELVRLEEFNCSIKMPSIAKQRTINQEGKTPSHEVMCMEQVIDQYDLSRVILYQFLIIVHPKESYNSNSMNEEELSDFYTQKLSEYRNENEGKKSEIKKIILGNKEGRYYDEETFSLSSTQSKYSIVLIDNIEYRFVLWTCLLYTSPSPRDRG